jgi:hypothetical protein
MSNFKVKGRRQREIRSLGLSYQKNKQLFLVDNEASVNKGNKQAAKLGSA